MAITTGTPHVEEPSINSFLQWCTSIGITKTFLTCPLPLQYGHFDFLESGSLLVPEHRSHSPCTRNDNSLEQPSTDSLNERFSETLQYKSTNYYGNRDIIPDEYWSYQMKIAGSYQSQIHQ